MSAEELETNWDKLDFGVRRSVRYHTRRRQFFDAVGFINSFLIVFMGSATAITAAKDSKFVTTFGVIVAILSAIDLIVGCSKKAREHHDLAREFSELQRQMNAAGSEVAERELIKFTNMRLEIEEEEPPKLCILDLLCHNEVLKALGRDEAFLVSVKWYQRLLCHVWDVSPNKCKRIGTPATA